MNSAYKPLIKLTAAIVAAAFAMTSMPASFRDSPLWRQGQSPKLAPGSRFGIGVAVKKIEKAKAILNRLNGGGLCRVLSESGVIFTKVKRENSDVLYELLNMKKARIAEIDEAFFEEDAPDMALAIVLLYMAIDLQDMIGNGGRYLEVVEGRRRHKEELARLLLFNGNGTNEALAKWALHKRNHDGDNRFATFLFRAYDDLTEAVTNKNKRMQKRIQAARGNLESGEGFLKEQDYAGLLYMLRALIFYLHKDKPDLYKRIIEGYPSLPAVGRHHDPKKAKKDVKVLRAFGEDPKRSLEEIAVSTGACSVKKFHTYSHILVDALMQDPIIREKIKDIIFEKNKLLPPLKVSGDELPLAAWVVYYMAQNKSTSERMKGLIRLYPALFNSRSGGLAFALRCRNVVEMIAGGNGLSRIRERLGRRDQIERRPLPKRTATRAIHVSLENALQFPEVREEFLRMKALMDAPSKWPERERLSIRGRMIRSILRNMKEKEFGQLMEDFHMLPNLQRLYTPAEVSRQEKALLYIREGGVNVKKKKRVRFRGTELLDDVMGHTIRNVEEHPLVLEAIGKRRSSQEIAFTEWDKQMVFRILRRISTRRRGILLREYPRLHAKTMCLFPKLLKQGYMNREPIDPSLIGFLHEGLTLSQMQEKLDDKPILVDTLQSDVARVVRVIWLSPIIAERVIKSFERRKQKLTLDEVCALVRLRAVSSALPAVLRKRLEKLEGSSPSATRWRRLFEAHHLTEADIIREKFPVEAILQHLPEVKLNKLLRSRMLSSAERKVLGLRLSDVPPVPIKEAAKRLEFDHKVVMETIRRAESRLEEYLYKSIRASNLSPGSRFGGNRNSTPGVEGVLVDRDSLIEQAMGKINDPSTVRLAAVRDSKMIFDEKNFEEYLWKKFEIRGEVATLLLSKLRATKIKDEIYLVVCADQANWEAADHAVGSSDLGAVFINKAYFDSLKDKTEIRFQIIKGIVEAFGIQGVSIDEMKDKLNAIPDEIRRQRERLEADSRRKLQAASLSFEAFAEGLSAEDATSIREELADIRGLFGEAEKAIALIGKARDEKSLRESSRDFSEKLETLRLRVNGLGALLARKKAERKKTPPEAARKGAVTTASPSQQAKSSEANGVQTVEFAYERSYPMWLPRLIYIFREELDISEEWLTRSDVPSEIKGEFRKFREAAEAFLDDPSNTKKSQKEGDVIFALDNTMRRYYSSRMKEAETTMNELSFRHVGTTIFERRAIMEFKPAPEKMSVYAEAREKHSAAQSNLQLWDATAKRFVQMWVLIQDPFADRLYMDFMDKVWQANHPSEGELRDVAGGIAGVLKESREKRGEKIDEKYAAHIFCEMLVAFSKEPHKVSSGPLVKPVNEKIKIKGSITLEGFLFQRRISERHIDVSVNGEVVPLPPGEYHSVRLKPGDRVRCVDRFRQPEGGAAPPSSSESLPQPAGIEIGIDECVRASN